MWDSSCSVAVSVEKRAVHYQTLGKLINSIYFLKKKKKNTTRKQIYKKFRVTFEISTDMVVPLKDRNVSFSYQ